MVVPDVLVDVIAATGTACAAADVFCLLLLINMLRSYGVFRSGFLG